MAANGYLEGLAAQRRDMGLPATCVGWGAIGDAGYLTRNQTLKESLTVRFGAAPLAAANALGMLERLLSHDLGAVAVGDFDWAALSRLLPSTQGPRFATVRRRKVARPPMWKAGWQNFLGHDRGQDGQEVRTIVQALVAQEVAQILCIAVDRIDPARSLHDLGMDSLMGIELALGLEERFAIRLPAMMLNEGPTVDRVSARIVERVMGADEHASEEPRDRLRIPVNAMAAQHGEAMPT